MFKIGEDLRRLTENYPDDLYIVGGFVRDTLMGKTPTDIDICGALSQDKMLEVAKSCGFKAVVVNKKLGTILITSTSKEQYEYTPFRVENYIGGNHSPETVEFVDDIKLDAKRRDFTCNSIYYNIKTEEIFDPYNGQGDIKNKILKAIETPEHVFSSDGLRILRLVRFAIKLDFKIDKNTLFTARQMTYQLQDISAERKQSEIKLILEEQSNNNAKTHYLKIFNDLNIYKYLFLLPRDKYVIKVNKLAKSIEKLSETMRFLSFVILFLLNKYNFKNMPDSQVEMDVINIMDKSLRCSKTETKIVLKCYLMIEQLMSKRINNILAVSFHNLSNLEQKIVEVFVNVKPVCRLILAMKLNGLPLKEKDLKIGAEDIKEFVPDKYISTVQKKIFLLCAEGRLKNEKETLLTFLTSVYKDTK